MTLNDLEIAEEKRKRDLARRAERRRTDPDYRERVNSQYRACYHRTIKFNINREKIREYHRKRRADPVINERIKEYSRRYIERHRIGRLVAHAIMRAKKSGKDYDEKFLRSLSLLRPEKCPCCSTILDYAFSGTKWVPIINGPSLDRIDTSRGYVAGNVEIICWRCNALKRDALLSELEMIVAYMRSRLC